MRKISMVQARNQKLAIDKLEFALRATKLVGPKPANVVRLKTFVDAAKKVSSVGICCIMTTTRSVRGAQFCTVALTAQVGVGLWNASYVDSLRIVDPEYLQSLGIK